MKFLFLKCVFVIGFSVITNVPLTAEKPGKDFLITLNGSKLTGVIKDINLSKEGSQLSFKNDFGDTYTVLPETIFGFVLQEGDETMLYESKCLDRVWWFVQIEKKGKVLSLFTSTERKLQFTNTNEPPIIVEEKAPQIWLQFAGEPPFKVYRFTYKGILRKKMKSYPDLAKRIGKRGFRYKNLSDIVELYNRFHEKKSTNSSEFLSKDPSTN